MQSYMDKTVRSITFRETCRLFHRNDHTFTYLLKQELTVNTLDSRVKAKEELLQGLREKLSSVNEHFSLTKKLLEAKTEECQVWSLC
jgi:hypothetical protein